MHDADFDHEHPSDFEFGEDIEGLEMFRLKSVGIDIGSSTTHLVFSLLTLRREGTGFSGRFRITDREILYRSRILLTPYLSQTRIDVETVKDFIRQAYSEAGLERDQIDTGAVVITGEALKKQNAQPLVEHFARESGEFICASAGPHHEALLAAHGCGAADLSKNEGAKVLNVDMGGGTTKLALIEEGVVTRTASISIGARLVAFGEDDVVTRVEEAGALLMAHNGDSVSVGDTISQDEKNRLGRQMAEILIDLIETGDTSELAQSLMVTPALTAYSGINSLDYLVFSGGVSEHIYGRDRASHGDLGPVLGKELQRYLQALPPGKLHASSEGIRATVIGAGEYTIQASGNTSYINDANLLPVYTLKVVRVPVHLDQPVAAALQSAFKKFDLEAFEPGLALALSVHGALNYTTLRQLAEGIGQVISAAPDCPLYLTLNEDVAKSLGGLLKEELQVPNPVIAIDGIDVGDLDYIDIGAPLGVSEVIPVTVKSLLFPAAEPDL